MLRFLRFRWKLWRLERDQRQTSDAYDKGIAAAKKRGEKHDKIYEIESLAHHEWRTFGDEIQRMHSRYLMIEAHKLILPTPDWEDKERWEQDEYPFNLTGHPAMSVPCGLTTEGLPVGLQLIGPWFGEQRMIDVATALENAGRWSERRPSL